MALSSNEDAAINSKASETTSTSAQAFFETGLVKFKQQDYRGAIADYRQAIALKPDFAAAYCAWGNACFAIKDYQSAIPCFNYAIRLNPYLAEAYGSRGLAYYEMGDKQQALDNLTQSIQINPQLANSYYSRGQINLELDNIPQAFADFEKTIDLFLSGETNNSIAYALAQIQKHYRSGIAYKDSPIESFIEQASKARQRGDIQAALPYITEAIQLEPKRAELYYHRGSAYQSLEQHSEALADFTRAIELNPRIADSYYNRGCVYFDQGSDACIPDFEHAAKLDPHLAQAHFNLGSFYISHGNKAKGVAYLQQASMLFQQMGDRQSYIRVMGALIHIQESL